MSESKNARAVEDSEFESQVLKASGLVMVDFWAEWCGPCKMLSPVIDALADQYAGQLKVLKMDVDSNESVPAKYQIRGIPTVMIFKDGAVVERLVGAQPRQVFEQAIGKHLGKG
jgi:thioredoxin 1